MREKGNASDAHLRVIETLDLPAVVQQLPQLRHIFTTGGKATDILLSFVPDGKHALRTGESLEFRLHDRLLSLTRLPSSSRAYPLKLEQKAAAYRAYFHTIGLL